MKKSVFLLGVMLLVFAGIGGCAAEDIPGLAERYTYSKIAGNETGLFPLAENSPMLKPGPDTYLKNPKTYTILRTTKVINDSARIDKLGIWLPMIEDWDSQLVPDPGTSSPTETFSLHDPESGTGMLFWEFDGEPGTGSTLTITEHFTCTAYEVQYDIDPDRVTAYDTADPGYTLYTRPEFKIESDAPDIVRIAANLSAEKSNPYYIARAIYDFLLDNLDFRQVEGLKGAEFACENRYGECGDYSALFVALCRAAGVPARPVVGRFASSIEGDWHVWAEFFLPGYGWVPVDPSVADLNDKREEYFGHIGNNLLIFNKAFKVTLNPKPVLIEPWYDVMQGWIWEYMGEAGEIDIKVDYSIEPVETGG